MSRVFFAGRRSCIVRQYENRLMGRFALCQIIVAFPAVTSSIALCLSYKNTFTLRRAYTFWAEDTFQQEGKFMYHEHKLEISSVLVTNFECLTFFNWLTSK